ncbi:MAG: cytochrome c [Anaerolineales bacterium]|nr:cytochrome c [Anaerolineales bacterium]
MKRFLKWLGIIILVLVGILAVGGGILYASTGRRLSKTYDFPVETVAVGNDTAVLERGEHLATILCTGCHGSNLGGTPFFEDPSLGSVPASNLTSGAGGVGSQYDDASWVRAIRHGVGYDDQALFIMPAGDFYHMSDEDLGAVIAYLKTLPPVDNELGEKQLKPLTRILVAAGAFGDVLNVETIDHEGPRPGYPTEEASTAYGDYLTRLVGCTTCHGDNLAGGQDPDPAAPPAPNITPGGSVQAWTEEDFFVAMQTGITPSGHQLSDFMPWQALAQMNDTELQAIWLYLQDLPALPDNAQ